MNGNFDAHAYQYIRMYNSVSSYIEAKHFTIEMSKHLECKAYCTKRQTECGKPRTQFAIQEMLNKTGIWGEKYLVRLSYKIS